MCFSKPKKPTTVSNTGSLSVGNFTRNKMGESEIVDFPYKRPDALLRKNGQNKRGKVEASIWGRVFQVPNAK
jgi:hypothetical protein